MKPGKQNCLKLALLASVTLTGVLSENALAQEPEDEIVVTGTRLQNQRAIDTRRDADGVVDAVTSDDIGRLPDFNVGEALQRLPGISVQNDQAEARFVTIRALNAEYNYTTIDGVSVAVPDRNGRRVFMDVMPASLAQRIDVVKTFTPNLEGGAIGGLIDIRTASAFDSKPNSFQINAEIGKYTNDEWYDDLGPSGTADAMYSTVFGDNDQFGLVVTGNYYKRESTIPQTEFASSRSFFNDDGTSAGSPDIDSYPGNGFAVPNQRAVFYYLNDRERYGGTAKLEFRPNDNAEYFIRGFWNTATDDEIRQTDVLEHNGRVIIADQTPTSGTILGTLNNSGRPFQRHLVGDFDFERTVWQIAGGGDLNLDQGELSLRLNYSGSSFENPETFRRWENRGDSNGNGIDDNAFSYQDIGDNLYQFTLLDPAGNRTYSNFPFVRDDLTERELNEDIYEAKLDWVAPFSGNWSYGAGASYRLIDRAFDEDRDRWTPAAGNGFDLATANVVEEGACLRGPGFLDGDCITAINVERLNSNLTAYRNANPDEFNFSEETNNDFDEDYDLEEETFALYGFLQWEDERHNLIFGGRFEDTSLDGTGFRLIDGTWTPVSNSGRYNYFLPSVNYTLKLNEDLLLRAAASKTIGRAPFDFIAPTGERQGTDSAGRPTLTRGNPDLQPRESLNFDVGLDYYFDDGQGILGANIFYKGVENEIFVGGTELDLPGFDQTVQVRQPLNNDRTVDIYGLELQAVKNLDFILSGLGVSANATFLDTNFTVNLDDDTVVDLVTGQGQPEVSYNAALFYDSDRLRARLGYNYIGEKKRQGIRLGANNFYRHRYETPEKTLDFKASYFVKDNLAVTFNAWNLTDEGRGEVIGFDQELPMLEAEFGRGFFVGFSYKH